MKKTIVICILACLLVALFSACDLYGLGRDFPTASEMTETKPSTAEATSDSPTEVLTVYDEATVPPTETEEPTEDVIEVSDDWTSCAIVIDGIQYNVFDPYAKFVENGWSFNPEDYGISEDYVLNPGKGVYATIKLSNAGKYGDAYNAPTITVGFINLDKENIKPLVDCEIDSIEINCTYAGKAVDNTYSFTVAPGFTRGATEAEIIAAIGEPNDVYEADGYKVLTYSNDYTQYMKLTVYDEYGLQGVRLNSH